MKAINLMKNAIPFTILLLASLAWQCGGKGDVNLSKAKPLVPEPVKGSGPNGTVPQENAPINPLFSYSPGQVVSAKSLGGIIDPTGTSIINDFDGDGIVNNDEITGSPWVSDYAQIDATVATPVSMTIEIDRDFSGQSTSVEQTILADDTENIRNTGTENIHRAENGLKTEKIVNEYSNRQKDTSAKNRPCSAPQAQGIPDTGCEPFGFEKGRELFAQKLGIQGALAGSADGYGKLSQTIDSFSHDVSTFKTETEFPDVPTVNNLQTDDWYLKSNSAARKSRNFRQEISQFNETNSTIRPDAGKVRAALYIKNNSINMPVRMTNILCTFMLETTSGKLIPMKSFRLRNDDYSLFSANLYGASTFGPYVIEIPNLNRAEIENALRLGYSPRIYIVDYEMTHVPDSNYRNALKFFSGNNLKIIEENAKGRTALLKIKATNKREMYRVAAFGVAGETDPCSNLVTTGLIPGISLETALKRMNCKVSDQANRGDGVGVGYETGDYILDLSEIIPNFSGNKVIFAHAIKQISGIETKLPCDSVVGTGSDGISRAACRMRPISTWTQKEFEDFGIWVVFANGKYFSYSEYQKYNNQLNYFDAAFVNGEKIPMIKGVGSTVWAGDNYDLVYISYKDFLAYAQQFGTNPLETRESFNVSTKWNNRLVPQGKKYEPETFSVYLGQAAPGEAIELEFTLKSTQKLDYNFGNVVDNTQYWQYQNFSYNLNTLPQKFDIEQALQFEISTGAGNQKSNWHDLTDTTSAEKLLPCNGGSGLDAKVDYVNQKFTLCILVPGNTQSDQNTLLSIFLRPKLLDEYRNVIWPEKLQNIKKFRGVLASDSLASFTAPSVVKLQSVIGAIVAGDTFTIAAPSDSTVYRVVSVDSSSPTDAAYTITVEQAANPGIGLATPHKANDLILANSAPLTSTQVKVNIDKNYFFQWNTFLASTSAAFNIFTTASVTDIFNLTHNALNWNWAGSNLTQNDIPSFDGLDSSHFLDLMGNTQNINPVPNDPTKKIWFNLNAVNSGVPVAADFTLAPAVGDFSDMPGDTHNLIFGSKILTMWRSVTGGNQGKITRLSGKIFDSLTGSSGPVFHVATNNSLNQYQEIFRGFSLKKQGNAALVVWYEKLSSAPQVQVRAAKITVPAGSDNNAAVSSTLELGLILSAVFNYERPNASVSSDKIMVTYQNGGSHCAISAIDISGLPVVSDTLDLGVCERSDVAFEGNNGVVAYKFIDLQETMKIQKIFFNGTFIPGGVYTVASSNYASFTRVAFKNNVAFVAWDDRGSGYQGRGAIVDFGLINPVNPAFTLTPLGSDAGTTIGSIAIENSKALVTWGSVNTTVPGGELLPALTYIPIPYTGLGNTVQLDTKIFPFSFMSNHDEFPIVTNGDDAWILWSSLFFDYGTFSVTSPSLTLKRIQLSTETISPVYQSPAFHLLPTLAVDWAAQAPVNVAFAGQTGINVAGPTSFDITGNFIGRSIQYGMNNFFTAPLLERQYTVTARLR